MLKTKANNNNNNKNNNNKLIRNLKIQGHSNGLENCNRPDKFQIKKRSKSSSRSRQDQGQDKFQITKYFNRNRKIEI